jgi:hypothetical protein
MRVGKEIEDRNSRCGSLKVRSSLTFSKDYDEEYPENSSARRTPLISTISSGPSK